MLSGHGVGQKGAGRFAPQGEAAHALTRVPRQERTEEQTHVLLAFPKRGKRDLESSNAGEQVFPEALVGHALPDILMRGADHAYVDGDGPGSPHGEHLGFLEHAEKSHLRLIGELRDLVQKQRSVVRRANQSGVIMGGSREGSLPVAEQFALDERLR